MGGIVLLLLVPIKIGGEKDTKVSGFPDFKKWGCTLIRGGVLKRSNTVISLDTGHVLAMKLTSLFGSPVGFWKPSESPV